MTAEGNAAPTVGSRLRAAREASGMSLASLAAITRINEAQLASLERDDFSQVAGDLYVRSFLRSCAEALGAPADEWLAAHTRQVRAEASREDAPDLWREEVTVRRVGRGAGGLWWRAAALVAAAAAAALLLPRLLGFGQRGGAPRSPSAAGPAPAATSADFESWAPAPPAASDTAGAASGASPDTLLP